MRTHSHTLIVSPAALPGTGVDVEAVGGWSEIWGGLSSLSKEESVCSCDGYLQFSLCWKRKQGEESRIVHHALHVLNTE